MSNKSNGNAHNKDMPRIGEHDASREFEVGDTVLVNFGLAGKLGPGVVTDKYQYENQYDEFVGYYVRLEVSVDEEFELGWIGSSILKPASIDGAFDL